MENNAHKLRVALGVLAQNLRGEGYEAYKPIGPDLAKSLAEFADNARLGIDDERLTYAVSINPDC